MIVKATRYEKLLKVHGAGAFGKVEYEDASKIILRTSTVKTSDLSGTVRIYFGNNREQVMSGRRFDPMGSNLVLMRAGTFYRVYTTVEIVKPLPKGVTAKIVLGDDVADVMALVSGPFREAFVGIIAFTIQPFRRIEMEKMTSLASLMFFEDAGVEAAPKRGNSDRTKNAKKPALKKPKTEETPETKVEAEDESGVSDEHPDNPES